MSFVLIRYLARLSSRSVAHAWPDKSVGIYRPEPPTKASLPDVQFIHLITKSLLHIPKVAHKEYKSILVDAAEE